MYAQQPQYDPHSPMSRPFNDMGTGNVSILDFVAVKEEAKKDVVEGEESTYNLTISRPRPGGPESPGVFYSKGTKLPVNGSNSHFFVFNIHQGNSYCVIFVLSSIITLIMCDNVQVYVCFCALVAYT